jgi:hypothetical protein
MAIITALRGGLSQEKSGHIFLNSGYEIAFGLNLLPVLPEQPAEPIGNKASNLRP